MILEVTYFAWWIYGCNSRREMAVRRYESSHAPSRNFCIEKSCCSIHRRLDFWRELDLLAHNSENTYTWLFWWIDWYSDVLQWEVVEFKSVILQIGFLRKFRLANGAFEGFFACMQQHVTFQIARVGEAFLAHFAMYWFIHKYLLSSIRKVF